MVMLCALPAWAVAPQLGMASHARQVTAAAMPLQRARAVQPAPETSTVSMLLVGLGLLALCVPRGKQEKFDQGR